MSNLPDKRISGYTPSSTDSDIIGVVSGEKVSWEDAQVFVTETDAYLMRKVIDKSRRYYMGVFESQFDEVTGERKTWIPMTEHSVESVVKSIDLDTKDVLVTASNPSAVPVVPIIRAALSELFDEIKFGQLLNDISRVLARDGTVVIKSYLYRNPKTGKKEIRSDIVDLLNIWIDPSAKSIQDTSIIERSLMSMAEVEEYRGTWDNIDYVPYSNQISRIWDMQSDSTLEEIPYTEIWERWGKIRKSWVTGKKKDIDTWEEGHIVTAGLGGPQVVLYIRLNPRDDGIKPYEECQYKKITGRWYGRGVPEMLFSLQEYLNLIINTRKANNMVLQNGMFLIRKGSGITPDMLSSITAGGGLPVTNINNDIKQLNVQDFRQSSYVDEDRIYLMADRVTSAFDITRGEVGKASASATATLSRERNIRDSFVLVQENVGFLIERLIMNHYIPLMKEMMDANHIIRVTGDADALSFIDQTIVDNRLNSFVKKEMSKTGFRPSQNDIQKFLFDQREGLKKMGKQRFIKYFSELFDEKVTIDVHVTDEKFNKVVAAQQLRDMLIAYSRLPVASKLDVDAVLREMLNIMGIKGEFFMEKAQLPEHLLAEGEGARLLKELPEQPPTELSGLLAGAKMSQAGAAAPRTGAALPRAGVAAPPAGAAQGGGLKSRLDIGTKLANIG